MTLILMENLLRDILANKIEMVEFPKNKFLILDNLLGRRNRNDAMKQLS